MKNDSIKTKMAVPNPGFRYLYGLLARLRNPERLRPEVRAQGLRLTWEDRAVSVGRDHPTAPSFGHLHANGFLEVAATCLPEDVVTLRNLAVNPERRFVRFGFDTQHCPFCGTSLDYGTLDFGLGHCQPCGHRLGWPCDQFTADCAEDDLREDIMREIEDEDRSQ